MCANSIFFLKVFLRRATEDGQFVFKGLAKITTQSNTKGKVTKSNTKEGITSNNNNTQLIGKQITKSTGEISQQTNIITNNFIPKTMDPTRATPLSAHEINTNNLMVTELLKRAVSNAFRHGLNLKPGKLNSANGNCLWESIIYNILGRICFKNKTKETSKQLRLRSLNAAQAQAQLLPFIESNTTEAEWTHIKKDKVFETKLGDICLVAASRAIKKDILIFNTNKIISISPMTLIGAEDYEGGQLTDNNPILMAYNGTHFESLETMSPEDDIRAIELVNLIKSNKYILNKTHIQSMARVSHNKPVTTTKESADKEGQSRGI